jgi:hypothetical protein
LLLEAISSLIVNDTGFVAFAEPAREMANNSTSNEIVIHLSIFCSLPHRRHELLTAA